MEPEMILDKSSNLVNEQTNLSRIHYTFNIYCNDEVIMTNFLSKSQMNVSTGAPINAAILNDHLWRKEGPRVCRKVGHEESNGELHLGEIVGQKELEDGVFSTKETEQLPPSSEGKRAMLELANLWTTSSNDGKNGKQFDAGRHKVLRQ